MLRISVLRDVYSSISDARCVFRLLGTTDAIDWYRSETDVGFIGGCNRVQALMMALYHPLEHVSWLGYASTHMEWLDPDKWSRWSDWCWVVYLVVDFVKVSVELRNLLQERDALLRNCRPRVCGAERQGCGTGNAGEHGCTLSDSVEGYTTLGALSIASLNSSSTSGSESKAERKNDDGDEKAAQHAEDSNASALRLEKDCHSEPDVESNRRQRLAEMEAEILHLQLQLLRDVLYFPNALHWGCEKPLLSRPVVATLGLAEALVGLVQAWRKMDSS